VFRSHILAVLSTDAINTFEISSLQHTSNIGPSELCEVLGIETPLLVISQSLTSLLQDPAIRNVSDELAGLNSRLLTESLGGLSTSICSQLHLKRFSAENHFFPRFNSFYGLKSLAYLGCSIWEEIPADIKDQGYLCVFQHHLKDIFLKNQFDKF